MLRISFYSEVLILVEHKVGKKIWQARKVLLLAIFI